MFSFFVENNPLLPILRSFWTILKIFHQVWSIHTPPRWEERTADCIRTRPSLAESDFFKRVQFARSVGNLHALSNLNKIWDSIQTAAFIDSRFPDFSVSSRLQPGFNSSIRMIFELYKKHFNNLDTGISITIFQALFKKTIYWLSSPSVLSILNSWLRLASGHSIGESIFKHEINYSRESCHRTWMRLGISRECSLG